MFYSCAPASRGSSTSIVKKRGKSLRVDIHCHYLNPEAAAKVAPLNPAQHEMQIRFANALTRETNKKQMAERAPKLSNIEVRLKDMDRQGIDIQAISPAPQQTYYWTEPKMGAELARQVNERLAEIVAKWPERFVGLGTVPLQNVDMAVAERAANGERLPPQWAGLKFFNVFGPNEYHKGAMMSVLARRFDDVKAGRPVQLFKSHREGVADGDQRRDFIYVDDVVRVTMWLLATPSVSGIFNVGTGTARSFRDLMLSAYAALGATPNIQYIDMPEQIRGSYQYFTQSEVDRLLRAGYNGGFTALEDAVERYVKGFLDRTDRFR